MNLLKNISKISLGLVRGLILGLTAFILVLSLFVLHIFGSRNMDVRLKMRRAWCNLAIAILGVKKQHKGNIPKGGPYLFVCNHRSSLDPVFILSDVLAYPISKYEVKNWPVIGFGAELSGVLYVDKSNKGSKNQTKDEIYKHLKNGNNVVLFPEGRTHGETSTIQYKKGSFEQAAKAGVPVVPMAIEYIDQRDYWRHILNFVNHFLIRFGKPITHLTVSYGKAYYHQDPLKMLSYSQQFADNEINNIRNTKNVSNKTRRRNLVSS